MPLVVAVALALLSLSIQAQPDISGAWAITVVDFGLPNTMRLVLKKDGDKLTGTLGYQALEGTVAGTEITFKSGTREAKGTLTGRAAREAARRPGAATSTAAGRSSRTRRR